MLGVFSLGRPTGIEPVITEPQSVVLPLHHGLHTICDGKSTRMNCVCSGSAAVHYTMVSIQFSFSGSEFRTAFAKPLPLARCWQGRVLERLYVILYGAGSGSQTRVFSLEGRHNIVIRYPPSSLCLYQKLGKGGMSLTVKT